MEEFKRKLKKSQNGSKKVNLFLLAVVVVLLIIGVSQISIDKDSWANFDGMNSGDYYKQEIYFLEGPFAVYEEEGKVTEKFYAAITTEDMYILVKTGVNTDLPVYGVDVTEENFETVEPVTIYGYSEELEPELVNFLLEFYNEGLEEEFFTKSNYIQYFGNCCIDTTTLPGTTGAVCIMFAVILIISIIILQVSGRKNNKNVDEQLKQLEEEGKLEIIKNEYEKYTVEKYKKVGIEITENYIISYTPTFEIIEIADVVNAYSTNIKDRTYQPVKNIALETKDNKKYYIGISPIYQKNKEFDEVLEKIKSRVKQGGR